MDIFIESHSSRRGFGGLARRPYVAYAILLSYVRIHDAKSVVLVN